MAGSDDPAETYQSLYRRYRPQRFAEVRGQDHVVLALRNAVRDGRVAHAYLFSGPRGTGKTSTARILAKALNCANPADGEPCGECDSCRDIARGASLDVHELDAASNNRVDDMRDLVSRASLASPGEWKVYIVDEVHMLSTAASNALLKTLEEPPSRVVFVLATTDPQKVLPTIRSRTQHYEFHLLEADVLSGLLEAIARDASLDVPPDGVKAAVRRGHGSARDAISALDQVAAAGVVEDDDRFVERLVSSIAEPDTELALRSVAEALVAGFDAPRLASDLIEALRGVFLSAVAPRMQAAAAGAAPPGLPPLGPARSVRALEALGAAVVDMRESLDARTTLELALVRLTHPDLDDSAAALLDRLERIERRVHELSGSAAPPAQPPAGPPGPGGRPALGAFRTERPVAAGSAEQAAPAPPAQAAPAPPAPAAPSAPAGAAMPTRDDLVTAWADHVLAKLRPRARAIYSSGRFTAVEGHDVTIALPNAAHVEHALPLTDEVAAVLSEHFGCAVTLRLVADSEDPALQGAGRRPGKAGGGAAPGGQEDEIEAIGPLDPGGLARDGVGTAHSSASWVESRLREEFPGAEEVP